MGSEMCIRDRLSIDAWYTEEVQKLENLLRKERALAKRCVPELEAA